VLRYYRLPTNRTPLWGSSEYTYSLFLPTGRPAGAQPTSHFLFLPTGRPAGAQPTSHFLFLPTGRPAGAHLNILILYFYR